MVCELSKDLNDTSKNNSLFYVNLESDDGSYEAEVEKADVFDSDFNDTETEDEEGSDDEKEVKRSQRKDSAKVIKS